MKSSQHAHHNPANITATSVPTQAPTLVTIASTLNQEEHGSIKAAQNLHNHLVLDLSNTGFIDAFGLNCILNINQELAQQGFSVALVNPQAAIRTLLFFTKIYHLIPSFPNLQQANQYLGRTVVSDTSSSTNQHTVN